MSEPRKLRPRKLQPVVLLPPVGRGNASPKVRHSSDTVSHNVEKICRRERGRQPRVQTMTGDFSPFVLRPFTQGAFSATDADTGGNVIGKSAPTQATGRPTRSRATKIVAAVVNTTVNDPPTPAPSLPSRAKKYVCR